MSRYNWGRDIARAIYPQLNGAAVELPTQSPSIYLFDSKPTEDDAKAGTGAISAQLTTWVEDSSSPFGRTFTHTAIDKDGDDVKRYWEAVGYVDTSETEHVVIRSFLVGDMLETDEIPGATATTLKDIYPSIGNYVSDTDLDEILDVAEEILRLDLEAKGTNWTRVYNLQKYKLTLAFKAIELSSMGQVRRTGDRFDRRVSYFQNLYSSNLSMIKLPYDFDGTGAPDSEAGPYNETVYIR